MTRRNLADLLLLGALWGASFLFMRLGAVEFGPLALAGLRVAGAAVVLLPLLAWRAQLGALRAHARLLFVLGAMTSALPFTLFGYAALALPSGLMAVFNATAPLWAAVIGWAWLGDAPGRARALGLAVGFAGVLALAAGKGSLDPGPLGVSAAAGIAACLASTLLYGLAANVTRRHGSAVPPLAMAAGTQVAAALQLAPLAWLNWPAQPPSARAWGAVALLAVLCTGLAYVLYFRLLASVGATRAISVTFLIPVFAALWGFVALGEVPTAAMVGGCAVILLGTALTTGMLSRRRRADEAGRAP